MIPLVRRYCQLNKENGLSEIVEKYVDRLMRHSQRKQLQDEIDSLVLGGDSWDLIKLEQSWGPLKNMKPIHEAY